jgi:hypothetical protein
MFLAVALANKPFPSYEYTLNTNEAGHVESITFNWREFQKLGEELSALRIYSTNTQSNAYKLDTLTVEEEKIELVLQKEKKKNNRKLVARSVLISTGASLIVGFLGGFKFRSSF